MQDGMNGQPEQANPVGEAAAALQAELGPRLEQVRDALERFNEKATRLMREYPGTCLLCALGAGFLFGRLASRR